MPSDSVERLGWINDQIADLLDAQRVALFDARLEGRLEDAIAASGLSRKRALALTRQENEARGRMIRWGDGL